MDPSDDSEVREEAAASEWGRDRRRDLNGKWSGAYISSALTAISLDVTGCHWMSLDVSSYIAAATGALPAPVTPPLWTMG